jgi:hypothetical protein
VTPPTTLYIFLTLTDFRGRTHIAGRIASPRSIEPHRNALEPIKSIKSIKSIGSAQFAQKRNKIAMHLPVLCFTLTRSHTEPNPVACSPTLPGLPGSLLGILWSSVRCLPAPSSTVLIFL